MHFNTLLFQIWHEKCVSRRDSAEKCGSSLAYANYFALFFIEIVDIASCFKTCSSTSNNEYRLSIYDIISHLFDLFLSLLVGFLFLCTISPWSGILSSCAQNKHIINECMLTSILFGDANCIFLVVHTFKEALNKLDWMLDIWIVIERFHRFQI
jgi:hypothetical protein